MAKKRSKKPSKRKGKRAKKVSTRIVSTRTVTKVVSNPKKRSKNSADRVRITSKAVYWVREDPGGKWRRASKEVAASVLSSPAGAPAKVRLTSRGKEIGVGVLAVRPPEYTSKHDYDGIRLWTWDFGAIPCGKVWTQIGKYTEDDVRRSELTGAPQPRYIELYTELGERLCGYPGAEANPTKDIKAEFIRKLRTTTGIHRTEFPSEKKISGVWYIGKDPWTHRMVIFSYRGKYAWRDKPHTHYRIALVENDSVRALGPIFESRAAAEKHSTLMKVQKNPRRGGRKPAAKKKNPKPKRVSSVRSLVAKALK